MWVVYLLLIACLRVLGFWVCEVTYAWGWIVCLLVVYFELVVWVLELPMAIVELFACGYC